jgi:hypothetical protein
MMFRTVGLILCCLASSCGVFTRLSGVWVDAVEDDYLGSRPYTCAGGNINPALGVMFVDSPAGAAECKLVATSNTRPGTMVTLIGDSTPNNVFLRCVTTPAASEIYCPWNTTIDLDKNDSATFVYTGRFFSCLSVEESVEDDE